MTDNETIKALECCGETPKCRECPYSQKCKYLLKDTIDLIRRQKAEIEELRKGFIADMEYFASEYDSKIKAEARKEFAERLKKVFWSRAECDILIRKAIDNLLEEMESERE